MKKIISIISFLALLLLLVGCRQEPLEEITYIYMNNSGYEVSIVAEPMIEEDIIVVGDDDTYRFKKVIYGLSGEEYDYLPFGAAEKVRVIFNSERELVFTLESELDGNIIYMQGYELVDYKKRSKRRHYYTYRYEFTPEMYERAEPIIQE